MDIQAFSNNNIYNDTIDYKDEPCCIGLRCNNSKTYLYQISLKIGSSFLCTDCKKSVEQIGWTLQRIGYAVKTEDEKQDSNRQLEIKNDVSNIKRTNKNNKSSSSKTLLKLQ